MKNQLFAGFGSQASSLTRRAGILPAPGRDAAQNPTGWKPVGRVRQDA